MCGGQALDGWSVLAFTNISNSLKITNKRKALKIGRRKGNKM